MDLKPVLSDGNALSVMRATVYTCSFIEMQRASFVTFFRQQCIWDLPIEFKARGGI